MKKVSFIDKILFFLNFKDISKDIKLEDNKKNNFIVTLIFGVCFLLMIMLVVPHTNIYVRLVLVCVIVFAIVELNYYLAVRNYKTKINNKNRKKK